VAYRAIVDSNILVYRRDPRDPRRQILARDLVRGGAADRSLAVPHQSIIEFVSAVSKPRIDGQPIVPAGDLAHEVEELLAALPVLYPSEEIVREALRARATYQLAWFDAHLLAYAVVYGIDELISEDFQHGRTYGGVRVRNPFIDQKESPRGGKAKA
jgi:predicted nucleic acid-binding protein